MCQMLQYTPFLMENTVRLPIPVSLTLRCTDPLLLLLGFLMPAGKIAADSI